MSSASSAPYRQTDAMVRFEWGLPGALAIADGAAAVVVVDVMSFTTTVSVAVDAGIDVYPYWFRDASAAAFAFTVSTVTSQSSMRPFPSASGRLSCPLSHIRCMFGRMLSAVLGHGLTVRLICRVRDLSILRKRGGAQVIRSLRSLFPQAVPNLGRNMVAKQRRQHFRHWRRHRDQRPQQHRNDDARNGNGFQADGDAHRNMGQRQYPVRR